VSSLPKQLELVLDLLRSAEDPDVRADFLIETAARFRPVPPEVAVRPFEECYRVPGCESEAFVWALAEGGRAKLFFAVENPQGVSAKALAVVLEEAIANASPDEIRSISRELAFDIFGRELSMGKGQGLMSMIEMSRKAALEALCAG
jgi:cysteine desulfuration protein SufE